MEGLAYSCLEAVLGRISAFKKNTLRANRYF